MSKRKKNPGGEPRDRGEEQEIDELAQRVFAACVPPAWYRRPQTPDLRVDYLVEPVHSGRATGLQIGVQLKGAKNPKTKAHVSKRMQTAHLAYYLKRDEPIFLIVADVTRSQAYYLFLQKYILNDLAPAGWQKQRTITVHVPITNDLSKIEEFEKAAIEARKYMNGARPGGISPAIAAEKQRLENIDPRIEVAIKATTEGIGYELNAKESFEFNMILKSDPEKANEHMRDLFERGLPIALEPTEIEFEGAPLLKHVVEEAARGKTGPIKLHASRSFDAKLGLRAIASDDSLKAQIDMDAKGEGGSAEIRVHAGLPNMPMEIDFTWHIVDGVLRSAPTFQYRFLFTRWRGKPIRRLPYFDQILSLLEAINDGCDLAIGCFIEGNKLFGGRVANHELRSKCDQVLFYLYLYAKARDIAAFVGADPTMPDDLTVEDLRVIEDLHWRLLVKHVVNPASMTVSIAIHRDKFDKVVQDAEKGTLAPLILKAPEEIASFLGKSYSFGPAEYTITNTKIRETGEELRALAASTDGPVPAHVEATTETEVTVKRLSNEPPKELPG
jgi:hypothetical protein